MKKSFLLVGGDRRFLRLGQLLRGAGHSVATLALEEGAPLCQTEAVAQGADGVILPIPPEDERGLVPAPLSGRRVVLEELLDQLPPGQLICSGGETETLRQGVEKRGLRVVNYLAREELAAQNAIPTAEGALRIAMEELPCTIHSVPALVIGCGNCGWALAQRLAALGAQVTVSARSQRDFARIDGAGYGVADTWRLEGVLPEMRLVYNTVPAPVLGGRQLALVPGNGLVVDLASRPGGVDWAAAEALGVKAVHALGLPGREAPETAAQILLQAIIHGMEECET